MKKAGKWIRSVWSDDIRGPTRDMRIQIQFREGHTAPQAPITAIARSRVPVVNMKAVIKQPQAAMNKIL